MATGHLAPSDVDISVGTYLEEYLSNIDQIPTTLRDRFNQMLNIDKESHKLMLEIEHMSSEYSKLYVSTQKQRTPEAAMKLEAIKSNLQKCFALNSEKCELATQTYDKIHDKVKVLEMELRNFEQDLSRSVKLEDYLKAQEEAMQRDYQISGEKYTHPNYADVSTVTLRKTIDNFSTLTEEQFREIGRSTRLNSSHIPLSRMPSSA
eukprot:TRINITY_DN2284_c0_g1_i1.p1 TRINITY_DN2284_c0_g1~~TRINITY_DN2284_c0_g1_i1.p1  ORF type:complete len:206 (+),score=41.47 TRINITY_DN2284_c0_g1_i1:91-708(+)